MAISCLMPMLVMQSCRTSKVEYKTVYVYPTLTFPQMPLINDTVHLDATFHKVDEGDEETDVAWDLVPHWWYKELARFKVYYEATEEEYKAFRESLKQ